MSSLFSNRQQTNFRDFARSVGSPQQAKERVEQMLRTGQISQQQYDDAMRRAQEVVRKLGIR